jgi:hypothetical protein
MRSQGLKIVNSSDDDSSDSDENTVLLTWNKALLKWNDNTC